MTKRIIERRGNQVYVEYEDDWSGQTIQEWQYEPMRMCACGRKEYGSCTETKVTTFTETYSCGYVYRYSNTNGLDDNLISVNGVRVTK